MAPDIPSPGEGQISIAVEGDTTGWVGCAFAEDPGVMFPADAIVGWVADGVADIKPYRVTVCRFEPHNLVHISKDE